MDNFSLRKSVEAFRREPVDYDYSPKGIMPESREYRFKGLTVEYYKDLFDDKKIDMDKIKSRDIYAGDGYLLRVIAVNDERVKCRVLQ